MLIENVNFLSILSDYDRSPKMFLIEMCSTLTYFLWLLCVNLAASGFIQHDGTTPNASILQKDVFGSKTAYRWVYKTSRPVITDEYMNISIDGAKCEAIHVTFVSRHGSRYPSSGDMERIPKLINKLKKNKGMSTFPFIDSLTFNYPVTQASQLLNVGKWELNQIGKRYSQRLNKLLDKESLDKFPFLSSSKERAKDSAKYFFKGMAEFRTGNVSMDIVPVINDTLMRFYKICDRYETAIEENATYLKEWYSFLGGPEISDVKNDLELRLGFGRNNALTTDEVHLAYEMCAFEMNIDNNDDWCSLFTEAERKVLEYASDLESYYTQTYGDPLMAQMSCPLIRNIFLNLDEVVRKDRSTLSSYPGGRFLFGHEDTLLPMYAAMSLFKDTEPLLATNMAAMANRKLRSSRVIPMAGNVAMVLYKCNNATDTGNMDYAVKLFVNEEPVFIPACSGSVCSYNVLRINMSEYIDMCDLNDVCLIQTTEQTTRQTSTAAILPLSMTIMTGMCVLFVIFHK